jgi:hypothetical protein
MIKEWREIAKTTSKQIHKSNRCSAKKETAFGIEP